MATTTRNAVTQCPDCRKPMSVFVNPVYLRCRDRSCDVFVFAKSGQREHNRMSTAACKQCGDSNDIGPCPGPAARAAPPPANTVCVHRWCCTTPTRSNNCYCLDCGDAFVATPAPPQPSNNIATWQCSNTACLARGSLRLVPGVNAAFCSNCAVTRPYAQVAAWNATLPSAPPPQRAGASFPSLFGPAKAPPGMQLMPLPDDWRAAGFTYASSARADPACCRSCRRELCSELDAPVYRNDDPNQCSKCRRSAA